MATNWGDPNWRREHLAAWSAKERLAHEHPSWGPARKVFAIEAAVQADKLPPHIANLMHAVANSEAPLKPEVHADVDAEIQRRLAAHQKET